MHKPFILYLTVFSFLFFSCGDADEKNVETDSVVTTHSDTSILLQDSNVDTPLSPLKKPVSELIKVQSPIEGEIIQSPYKVTGEAVGFWYFEADFPVR